MLPRREKVFKGLPCPLCHGSSNCMAGESPCCFSMPWLTRWKTQMGQPNGGFVSSCAASLRGQGDDCPASLPATDTAWMGSQGCGWLHPISRGRVCPSPTKVCYDGQHSTEMPVAKSQVHPPPLRLVCPKLLPALCRRHRQVPCPRGPQGHPVIHGPSAPAGSILLAASAAEPLLQL